MPGCLMLWGGAFERLVKSTKRCLRKQIASAHFPFDKLLTAVTEIEAGEDLEKPLTPSHLLVGRRILSLPDHIGYLCDPDDEEFAVDSVQLTGRAKHLNNTLNHFWNRWRTEYLNELREAHGHSTNKTHAIDKPNLSLGDVVILHNERLPRGLWKLGRIQELLEGHDSHYRGAVVKTTSRDGRLELLQQPIQLLYMYPLELKTFSDGYETSDKADSSLEIMNPSKKPPTDKEDEDKAEKGTDNPAKPRRQSRRLAAQRGDEQRKACMFEFND